ncbi:Protein translocase subunit SecA [Buchnera aphidicola (Thelaxes suberi)]|uniref:preprotein translocase subunit SecA n=1 Tax=Buchnera aphidicola TaxID=9 RepID=UPI003463AF63
MLMEWLNKWFGNHNNYVLNKAKNIVNDINMLEPKMIKLKDQDFKKKTYEFKQFIKKNQDLDSILPEAYALVREASKRVFGMRHFDVQLLGGIILNQNSIAEMRTGEGKTLTSTLPAYLNALNNSGVHIVTMNDYLAKRDAKINEPLFNFLGLQIGLNASGMSLNEKRKAYSCDITYGTNNEYSFDYLKDNMVLSRNDCVQRSLHYALIDEVDSILIDESRTPLVISGPIEGYSKIYLEINRIVLVLIKLAQKNKKRVSCNQYFSIDEKQKQIHLTELGLTKVEELLVEFNILNINESLYYSDNIILLNYVISSLRAHILFFKNVDYFINKKKEIIIIDEHTGRLMEGRRWSEGLHQSIEAKENVKINNENRTLASITFQSYFRLYDKLSGMTGTAETESFEFSTIYNLNTIVIPTNKNMIRTDYSDLVFLTKEEKINAIILDIKQRISKKQPVLVGTISIEQSEIISSILDNMNIKHNVLNAKYHDKEAKIISEAGCPGVVTIATNMAGRGTDIVLGGSFFEKKQCLDDIDAKNKKFFYEQKKWKRDHNFVVSVGGLHIIGTERHESRRIDNQLRGRSGRQGDPGSSRFYLSMEDLLIRIFIPDGVKNLIQNLGIKKNEFIQHQWLNKAIENAQNVVESRNFEIRKQLLEYDDVDNDQRSTIYEQRNYLLCKKEISNTILIIAKDVFSSVIHENCRKDNHKNDVIKKIEKLLLDKFYMNIKLDNFNKELSSSNKKYFLHKIYAYFMYFYTIKRKEIGIKKFQILEKNIMITTLDNLWIEHLSSIEFIKQSIHLCSYAQKDPKQEYKKETFKMFISMLQGIKKEVITALCLLIFSK